MKDSEEMSVKDVERCLINKNWEKAEKIIRDIQSQNEDVRSHNMDKLEEYRAVVLHRKNMLDESACIFRKLVYEKRIDENGWFNFSQLMVDMGDIDGAIEMLYRLLRGQDKWVAASRQLAYLSQRKGFHQQALYFYTRVLNSGECNDDDKKAYGFSLLHEKDFALGWEYYEFRERSWNLEWLKADWIPGEPIEGKSVVVIVDEGIGDAVMFAPLLKRMERDCRDHVIYCDKRISGILRRSYPQLKIETQVLDERFKDYDVRIRLGSLPLIYWRDIEEIRKDSGTRLVVEDGMKRFWSEELSKSDGELTVGLAWRGGVHDKYERERRSFSLLSLKCLLERDNINWLSLQYGDVKDEIKKVEDTLAVKIRVIEGLANNVDELCALLVNLDFVITCEQTVAHLAGALNVDCLVLKGDPPGWRYISRDQDDDRLIWYESVRLRSKQGKEWIEWCESKLNQKTGRIRRDAAGNNKDAADGGSC